MKAHSARVPGKNFKPFAGKPLFRWIVDVVLSIPEVETLVINTDARDILESLGLSSNGRVLIRDRRAAICGDDVSMNEVLADDIAAVKGSVYLMTHTTNPLLSRETIARAVARFQEAVASGEADSLFTVNRYQSRFYDAQARPLNHDPERLVMTQELEPWFEENSNLYLFTWESFTRTKARIGRRPLMFETPRRESVDIDNAADWALAEALASAIERST